MQKTALVAIAVAAAVASMAAIAITQNPGSMPPTADDPAGPPGIQAPDSAQGPEPAHNAEFLQSSGPFNIDKKQYMLGEKIFISISGLDPQDRGQMAFLRPLNQTHYSVYSTVPFDGQDKPEFNYYIEPQVSKTLGVCTAAGLVGEWTVVFRGTDYPNLKFKVTDKILAGSEEHFAPVC